jgi:hypothetical protein
MSLVTFMIVGGVFYLWAKDRTELKSLGTLKPNNNIVPAYRSVNEVDWNKSMEQYSNFDQVDINNLQKVLDINGDLKLYGVNNRTVHILDRNSQQVLGKYDTIDNSFSSFQKNL